LGEPERKKAEKSMGDRSNNTNTLHGTLKETTKNANTTHGKKGNTVWKEGKAWWPKFNQLCRKKEKNTSKVKERADSNV